MTCMLTTIFSLKTTLKKKYNTLCYNLPSALTLVIMNKLTYHARFIFQPVRLLDPVYWYKFTHWMINSTGPDQLASLEAIWSESTITRTYLYYFDPLKPHFYIVKLGFTGVCFIFLISAQNIDCGYSLEPPRRGGSNEYPQSMFWAEIRKNIRIFFLKIFFFLGDKIFSMFE